MDALRIIVRAARQGDAAVIAKAVAMAIGDEVALRNYCGSEPFAVLEEMAAGTGTQYGWQNALVAEVDGVVAGAVVGYDGSRLNELREGTFDILLKRVGSVPKIADETSSGEFYLDSIGVFEEFRGNGVGQKLIKAFCDMAFAKGYDCVGLIVDYDNPKAEKLYSSLGFERVGTKDFFGHRMWHLQCWRDIRAKVELSSAITEFQRKVYLELLDIPAGSTITYGELAKRVGCRSPQAVGQALKHNPFAPEVPCHRVVRSDGTIGGYKGMTDGEQIQKKRLLLEFEQELALAQVEEIIFRTGQALEPKNL